MHAGELVELAKEIQIEELRDQIAVQYPPKGILEMLSLEEPQKLYE